MIKKLILLFLLLFPLYNYSVAQQDKVVIRFIDVESGGPLSNVNILAPNGQLLGKSDSTGYAALLFSVFNSSGYVLAITTGFRPDTIYTPTAVIYLHPLSATLNTAIVRSNRVNKLLHESNEYVVDYDFAGDNIVAATYSGNNGGRAKLFLLNNEGEEQARCKLPDEPISLFRSCAGNCYTVCRNRFYPLTIGAKNVSLNTPYRINLLRSLQECEQSVSGNLYYRLNDKINFRVTYGMIARGDSVFKLIEQFEEKDVARASMQEYYEILALLESGQFNEAARKQMLRSKWDKGSYAHISIPLFTTADTLVIFDYFKKRILYYNLYGVPLGNCNIHFQWKQSQQFSIIKDEATNKFYIHRYDNPKRQTLEELNVHTGITIGSAMAIDKPFAERVKIHKGNIYYLWQDKIAQGTRQLFIQYP